MSKAFDFATVTAPDLPPPAVKFGGYPKFNFVGGHNDPDSLPVADLTEAVTAVMKREARSLAMYNSTGPQGYLPLRQFLVKKLKADAGIACTADDVLITSGSLQGMDLVNSLLVGPGDTVIVEEDNYGGTFTKLARIKGKCVGVPLDRDGMRMDALAATLADLKSKGIKPKYIYTIPTVHNPTGTVMPVERRREMIRLAEAYGVPIFEDDCYSDLVFSGERPPAIYALSDWPGVIHIGSFSKSIAPALRIGFVVAPWDAMSRILALKGDAGTPAIEQMALAEFCEKNFDTHVGKLRTALKAKADAMVAALEEHFGTAAEFERPTGGIFIWVKLPEPVDTTKLFQVAAKHGIALNPGPEWSIADGRNKRQMRLCFAYPSKDVIRNGVAALAEVCRTEFGIPERIANVKR
ncbi:MAG TPA: PLP-dependent aminotransferase family protein [Hyphomicrobiaceae bacterium]|nr:PLP-dependent aminotransferase family protein [Hyphomicrobiaceae bacterium]